MAGGSVDDVFVIVMFTAFTGLALGGNISAVSILQIPVSILSGLVLGVLLGWLLTRYFKRYHMRDSEGAHHTQCVISAGGSKECLKAFCRIGIAGCNGIRSYSFENYEVLALRLSAKFSKLWVGAEILLFVLVELRLI